MKSTGTLRRALAVADGRSESVSESYSHATMMALGLPVPNLQVVVFDDAGHAIGRCDFAWEDKVIGEFDSKITYTGHVGTSTSETVFAEKCREDAIRRTGRIVVRRTWHDLANTVAFRSLIPSAPGGADTHDVRHVHVRPHRRLVLTGDVVKPGL